MRSDTQTRRRGEARPGAMRPRRRELLAAGFLGGAFLIAVAMAWQSIAGGGLAGCGPDSDCETVLASRWGSFLGVPVSLFGAIIYGYLLAGKCQRREPEPLDAALRAIAGNLVLAGALWFFFVQAVVLKAYCPWCCAAHALASAGVIIGWPTRGRAAGGPAMRVRPLAPVALALPVLAVAGLAAIQAYGPEPERIRQVTLAKGDAPGRDSHGGDPMPAPDLSGFPWIGARDAAVVGVALTDFTCPHCRQLERMLSEAAETEAGRFGVALLPGYHDDEARDLHRVMLALWRIDRDHHGRIAYALVEGVIEPNAEAVMKEIRAELGDRFYELAWPHGEWIEDALRQGREAMSRNEREHGLFTLPQLILGGQAIAGLPKRETLLALVRNAPAELPATAAPAAPVSANPSAPPSMVPADAGAAPAAAEAPAPANAGDGPRIAFEKEIVDLGTVTRGEKVPFMVRFTNTGNAALHITKIKPSCACTTIAGGEQTVAAGESGSFEVEFDSAHFVGEVSKAIVVETSDPRGGGSLAFRANVWTPVRVEPRMILFGSVVKGTTVAPRRVEIVVQDEEPIRIGEITCSSSYYKWEVATIEEGRRYAITVSVPDLGEEAQRGEFLIPVGHSKLDTVSFTALINPVDLVMVHPPAIERLASVPAEPQIMGVRVDCNDPALPKFEITDLAYVGGSDVELALVMSSSRWGTIRITLPAGFDAAAEEARGAHVAFRTNHPDYPVMRVPVRTMTLEGAR